MIFAICSLALTITVCTIFIINSIRAIPERKVIDKTVTINKTEIVKNEKIAALLYADKILSKTYDDLNNTRNLCNGVEPHLRRVLTNKMMETANKRYELSKKLEELSKECDLSGALA